MTSMQLTCDETPLKWPRSATLEDLTVCKSCGFILHAPNPGSLQVQTRRAGDGVGDGVNVMEASDIGLDFRGQRYTFEEAIFHTPGLHVFPGEKEVFPAEYHLHFRTLTAPLRGVSIIIPVSHRVTGIGADYFAAISGRPDPSVQRPTLASILTPGTDVLQYQATDIRGRTEDVQEPATCGDRYERQFLLVLRPCAIYASDLERIPREGSLSTRPSDLPAPGVKTKQSLPIDRAKRTLLLARPGIFGGETMTSPAFNSGVSEREELQCKPVKIVDGRDVVDICGETMDLLKLLGLDSNGGGRLGAGTPPSAPQNPIEYLDSHPMIKQFCYLLPILIGVFAADYFFKKVIWKGFFHGMSRFEYPFIQYVFLIFLACIIAAIVAIMPTPDL
jgi:hypothetical protein